MALGKGGKQGDCLILDGTGSAVGDKKFELIILEDQW